MNDRSLINVKAYFKRRLKDGDKKYNNLLKHFQQQMVDLNKYVKLAEIQQDIIDKLLSTASKKK